MKQRLLKEALIKYAAGVLLVGLMLFVPAGRWNWFNGKLFMVLLFVPMGIAGLIMYRNNPDLLRRRLDAKERQSAQKEVISLSALMFVAAFLVAGFNARFGWVFFPNWLVILGIGFFLIGYALFGMVLMQNEYLSRTIQVQEDQPLIDTGLYGIVRHPMYSATVLLFLSMGLVLDSPLSFLILLGYIPLIVKRIKNEEEVLEKELTGYSAYKEKVKYRLIPYIW